MVKEVEDADGKVIYKAEPEKKRAVSEDIAHDVTYALSNVVEQGTGRTVQTLNRPVAGKTGTNGVDRGDDIVNSSWFVGYTKQISTAVMYVAGDSGSESLDDYRRPGDSTFFGGTYPAQTWVDYMQVATEDQPVQQFDPPAYVNADSAPQPSATATQQQQPTQQPSATQEPSEEPSSEPSAEPGEEPSSQQPEPSEEPSQSTEPDPEPSASSGTGDGPNGDEENAGGDATPAGGG